MRIRRLWLVVIVLIPAAAGAHDHKADFFLSLSHTRGSNLVGTHETIALTSPIPDSHDLTIILGDLSIHRGSHRGDTVTRTAVMSGLRWTVPGTRGHTHRAFGQLLAGVAHDESALDRTDPAIAPGLGYEFHPDADDSKVAVRVQFDYVFRNGDGFPRLSGGIVIRKRRSP